MISRIWKLILIWISVLCLSGVACIMFALKSGLLQETYFVSGYVVCALICIMMFCTILSAILARYTRLCEPGECTGNSKNIHEIANRDLQLIDITRDTTAEEKVVDDKEVLAEYNDTLPTNAEDEEADNQSKN